VTEVPDECFDPQGNVACFRCYQTEEPEVFVITPPTRDTEMVRTAFQQHARQQGHALLLTLAIGGVDGKVHVWQEPVIAAGVMEDEADADVPYGMHETNLAPWERPYALPADPPETITPPEP
jgi:hypothetical protein